MKLKICSLLHEKGTLHSLPILCAYVKRFVSFLADRENKYINSLLYSIRLSCALQSTSTSFLSHTLFLNTFTTIVYVATLNQCSSSSSRCFREVYESPIAVLFKNHSMGIVV